MVSSGGSHRTASSIACGISDAIGANGVELLGVGEQPEQQVPQRAVGGLDAGREQQAQEGEDLLVGELLAVDLGLREAADQVVARLVAGAPRGSGRSTPAAPSEAATPRSRLTVMLSSEIDQRWNCG